MDDELRGGVCRKVAVKGPGWGRGMEGDRVGGREGVGDDYDDGDDGDD